MPAFVPAAARTLRLFEVFAETRCEMSNAEIAKALGVPETSSLDLLHTLLQLGYLVRTPRSRRFYPTPRLLAVAAALAGKDPLLAVSGEVLEILRDETGETTICAQLRDHHIEVLNVREGKHELRCMLPVGQRMAMHVSAVGKALLAELGADNAATLIGAKPLKAVTPHSVTDPAKLMLQLRAAQRQGMAETEDEGTEGVAAMAVAGRIGDQLVAFSIFGPTERLKRQRVAYRKALLRAKELAFGLEGAPAETIAPVT